MIALSGLTPDRFYEERDSRTNQVVPQPAEPVAITVGIAPRWAATRTGQLAMYWLSGLIARMGRRYNGLQLWFPQSVGQLPCLIHGVQADSFAAAILQHLRAADPFGRYTTTMRPDSKTYQICVGASVGQHTRLVVRPLGWAAATGTPTSLTSAVPDQDDGNPIGAALAAALGAAAVYQMCNQAHLHYDAQLPIWLSAWQHTTTERASIAATWESGSGLPSALDIGRWLVVGAGALGGNALTILGQVTGLTGYIGSVDPDTIDISNLNRLEFAGIADVGQPKVEVVRRVLAHTDVEFEPRRGYYERIQESGSSTAIPLDGFDLVLGGVDRLDTRAYLQAGWPRMLIDGGTRSFTWRVSAHRVNTDGACLGCIVGKSQSAYRNLNAPLACAVGAPTQQAAPNPPMDSYGFVSFLGATFLAASALRTVLDPRTGGLVTPVTRADALALTHLEHTDMAPSARCICLCQEPVVHEYRAGKYASR